MPSVITRFAVSGTVSLLCAARKLVGVVSVNSAADRAQVDRMPSVITWFDVSGTRICYLLPTKQRCCGRSIQLLTEHRWTACPP